MRSRYCAFVLGLREYLVESWHPSTRPEELELDPEIEWRRLFISDTSRGGEHDNEGFVTFTAIARTPQGRMEQRERSRFVRGGTLVRDGAAGRDGAGAAGRWLYLDGIVL